MIREISTEDMPRIEKLYNEFCKEEFPLPHPFMKIGDAAVKNSIGEIVAYGMLEVFTEALLVLDRKKTLIEKSEAVATLIGVAKAQARKLGIPAIYIFARDPKWSEELKKHFGFKPCDGECLIMRL